jgi:hypothetical protein
VAAVGIIGQLSQIAHQARPERIQSAKQEMGVVVQKYPRIADRAVLTQQGGQPIQHALTVVIFFTKRCKGDRSRGYRQKA